ncbi:MAG: hypothetical protein AAGF92_02100 [Myxococcota bacterium]
MAMKLPQEGEEWGGVVLGVGCVGEVAEHFEGEHADDVGAAFGECARVDRASHSVGREVRGLFQGEGDELDCVGQRWGVFL